MKLTCKHCDYTWEYGGSQKYYATCPQCRYKVRIREIDNKTEAE